ncbi:fibrinogen-binding protein [Staphylococcus aureus]
MLFLTVSTFAGESHAQTKVEKYNEYQTNFKKQVNKKVMDAQKAVNLFERSRLLQHTVKHKELLI